MSRLPEIANPHRQAYPSDMSDRAWVVLRRLIPEPKGFGHPRMVNLREIINAIFYVQRSGCQWEMLPHDFPPHPTVYGYFRKWQRKGIWQRMHDQLRHQLRQQMGREEDSSVAIADSQSVKTAEKRGPVYGYDGGKKVKGRKRHIVVDSQGLLIGMLVSEANGSERLGAVVVLHDAIAQLRQLEVIWVDQGYSGKNFVHAVQQVCGEDVRVEVIERTSKEFEILPKRWIVERTFGWLNRFRRLSKDYELYTTISEAMIYGSLIRLMTRRLAS
ncbi:MAG: IS5 family transposase [Moorea sp. SIO3I7]|nr:IS5 family transposase [Moorena sp. SIO3I7]NEP29672.1 IS5 family transposase [Moorena sp. SIO3I6]